MDLWSFVPHYPYPPEGRRWAMGMQQAGMNNWLGQFSLLVHTTHASRTDGGSTEQYVASNSCKLPLYRVMLWYNNPYHFLTGFVEAQNTTGEPSQVDKVNGGHSERWLDVVCGQESIRCGW